MKKADRNKEESMTEKVDRTVERNWRERLFAEAEIVYRELEADPDAMAELESEYALWESTTADGLEREDW